MINEKALRDALVALAKQQLTQYESYALLAEQVAILEETVRGLDPTFDDVRAQKRAHRARTSSSAVIVPAVKAQLSEIIRILKSGNVC
jgi:predicted unusual protein kinase regulating ubiquinone biosynthesis (AarF/ABC1/UbiB family)